MTFSFLVEFTSSSMPGSDYPVHDLRLVGLPDDADRGEKGVRSSQY